MERKIDIDLIIWLVLLLLLFGGSLVKWLIHRFGREKTRPELTEGEKEIAPQEKSPTFMEEFKKMLEGMVVEERPEIVIVEERPHKRRPKHLKTKVSKETVPTPQPVVKKEELPIVSGVTLPMPKAPLVRVLSGNELQKAIVLSEILGPPRAKRRHYRLF